MSANVDTVKTMYECFGRGDIPGILAHLAEDVEWEHDWGGETMRWYEPRRGKAAIPGFFMTLSDFEFLQFEPLAFLEGDGMVAVPVRIELEFKANGKRIRDLEMHLWTFGPGGQVTRFRHLVDTLQFATATRA